MSSPSTLFCKMLQQQYDSTIDAVEDIVNIPLTGIRDVKSNILRVEKLVYSVTKTEVDRIEKLLIEVLLLDQINQLENVDNFCQVAFLCQILVETLIDNSDIYLSFLDQNIIDQLSSNYALFEQYVCVLGLRNIVNNFTTSILADLRARLLTLLTALEDALRLDELRYLYNRILINSGIFELLNNLKKFGECAFGACDWATTSTNKIEDYSNKLAISENVVSASGWGEDINSLLNNYYELDTEIDTKINYLIELIDNRGFDRGIPRDNVMVL